MGRVELMNFSKDIYVILSCLNKAGLYGRVLTKKTFLKLQNAKTRLEFAKTHES